MEELVNRTVLAQFSKVPVAESHITRQFSKLSVRYAQGYERYRFDMLH